MLDAGRAREICDRVLRASNADGCEVSLGGGIDALTRFANNEIHQNMRSESYELSVRSIVGQRTGRASTTRLDDDGIHDVVRASEATTRLMPESPDLQPLLGPQDYTPAGACYDRLTADLDASARAERAGLMIDEAKQRGLTAAGIVRTVEGDVGDYGEKGTIALANSEGLFAQYSATWLKCSVTMMAEDSSGWADAESHVAADLDASEVGRIAAEKAVASRQPRSIPARDYSVILEAAAVAELLAFLSPEFSATLVEEGRSFLSNRQGERIFGDNVFLYSDPFHPLHAGRPFDEEGVPAKSVPLVENGVHRNLVYDRITAQRSGQAPSGHGLRIPTTEGAFARCLVLRGGETTLPAMIESTQQGILVTRVWYTRPVDPVNLVITGMTRDGTFWIEDGAVQHAVKNLRFNISLLDLLSCVEQLGPQVYSWPAVVAPMKVSHFHFTSETSF